MKKLQDLKLKVLNTEQTANGEVKLVLRSSQTITPAMRRAIGSDADVTSVVRGNKSDKVIVMLDTPAYAQRNKPRKWLVEDLTARAAKVA